VVGYISTELSNFYLRQGGYYVFAFVCLSVCLSAGYLKELLTNLDEIFGGMGSITNTSCLDFGGELGLGVSTGIFNYFYNCEIGAIRQILLIIQKVVDEFL